MTATRQFTARQHAGKPSYWELLRHPNWQKKRLEIMDRDGFKCLWCDSDEKPLNVHHSYYERGLAPWEYPSASLHTLCEDCHENAQNSLTQLHREIGRLSLGDIEILWGVALGIQMQASPDLQICIPNGQVCEGIGMMFRVNGGAVARAANSLSRVSGETMFKVMFQVMDSPNSTYDPAINIEPEEK